MLAVASRARQLPCGVPVYGPEDIDAIIGRTDVIFLSLPINDRSDLLFDANRLARCKDKCVVVNVGRGRVIGNIELAKRLMSGAIAGAGIDVVDPEPLPKGHPLWRAPNVIHIDAKLIFVPKYSPDLNPIEMFVAKVKHWLRKAARRSTDAIYNAIAAILPDVSSNQCRNFFAHAGYGPR